MWGFRKKVGGFGFQTIWHRDTFWDRRLLGSTISPVSFDSIPAICPETAARLRTEDREILVCGEFLATIIVSAHL